MKVIKTKGQVSGYDFYLLQDNKILKIVFGGNLDLYWNLIINNHLDEEKYYTKNMDSEIQETFIITKENYFLYSLFENIIEDIKEVKIFGSEETTNNKKEQYSFLGTDEENKWFNEKLKNRYYYSKLYDGKNITWHSDDDEYNIADRVIITKKNDIIILQFIRPKLNKDTFHYREIGSISIRFRTSGSRYDEFYIPFMRMYNKLQSYNPDYHQMHIEEIEYQKKLTLQKHPNN